MQKAILAGGCFWGVEEILRQIKGIQSVDVGYIGGQTPNPTYEQVKTGSTGHAEAVQIHFDERLISYEEILHYFFRLHDPTQVNRQQNDIGSQYRSAIFFINEEQELSARKVIKEVETSKKWKAPIVTQVQKSSEFYMAEAYHQDYLQKNPNGYNCHYLRD